MHESQPERSVLEQDPTVMPTIGMASGQQVNLLIIVKSSCYHVTEKENPQYRYGCSQSGSLAV